MEAAWKSTLVEAERLSDVHVGVRDKLVNDVCPKIREWQKDNYHKVRSSLMSRCLHMPIKSPLGFFLA
jgi:hypothetical protein